MTDRLASHRPARSRATTGGCRVRGRRLQAPATAPDDPLRRRRDRQILHGAVLGRHPRAARPARAVRGLGVERGGSPGPAGTAREATPEQQQFTRQVGEAVMEAMKNRRWWHYTLGTTLIKIIRDGRIKRASARVARRERRAVWFSCHETWEPTATKGILTSAGVRDATIADMVAMGGLLVRIEVSQAAARHDWHYHRRMSGVDPRAADALENAARGRGSEPTEWRVSYQDVPFSAVISVEASRDGAIWRQVGHPVGDSMAVVDADLFQDILRVL